jgi:hypothetical protein
MCSENKPFDTGMDQRAHAHDAGLYGNIDLGIDQPVIVQPLSCGAQRKNFSVCCGVLQRDGAVEGTGDNFTVPYHYCPDRDFILRESCAGLLKCRPHKNVVVLIWQNIKTV